METISTGCSELRDDAVFVGGLVAASASTTESTGINWNQLESTVVEHTETQSSHLNLLKTIAPHTYTHIYGFLAMIFVVVGGVFIYREVTIAIYSIWLSS